MSTKQSSTKKRILLSIAYWIIIILIGYLLMQTNLGTGNGNGKGGSGGGHDTGMSSSGTGDGGGDTDRNTTGYSGDESEPTGAENGQDDENSQDAQQPVEEQEQQLPVGEPDNKTPSPVQATQAKPQTITIEKPIPKLSAQPPTGEKDEDPQGDFYKVVTGSEAKKGFFGIEVDGREKAFFILDVSGSMGASTAERLSRIELMKNVFSAEIDRLHGAVQNERLETKRGRFIFASFSDNVKIFPESECYRYDLYKDVKQAKKNVSELNIQGGTSMFHAFVSLKEHILKLETNTIYLLTDGEPTDCSSEQLLKWLKKNLPNQKISTFSLGTQSQLLRDIAKQHHGKYREIL